MVADMETNQVVAELEANASRLEAEAKAYRDAAAVLRKTTEAKVSPRPVSPPRKQAAVTRPRSRKSPTGTMSMARSQLLLAEEPLTPPDLAQRMLEAGWNTDSDNPANTLRTALRRMLDKHDSGVHVRNGRYFIER